MLPVLLAAIAAVLLAVAPAALAGPFTPESGGSPNADDINTLYKITLYIGIVIFIGVEGALIWALVKFRARRGGPAPQQIRGNTPLELGWTVGAGVIVLILAVVTFIYLDDIRNPAASGPNGLDVAGTQFASVDQPSPPGGDSLRIRVTGQQYLWRYDYPSEEQLFSFHEMVVPTNTTVELDITASDVIHSWWIPKLGGKMDGVPGHVNETWFKISKPGLYPGWCAELCGDGHADMRAVVRAVPPDEFLAWAEEQRQEIREAQEELAEARRAAGEEPAGGADQRIEEPPDRPTQSTEPTEPQ